MKRKIVLVLLICTSLVCTSLIAKSSYSLADDKYHIIPDKNIINEKVHINKLSQLNKLENGTNEVQSYLSNLSLKELLETSAEFANEGQLNDLGLVLSPHLQKKLDKNVPLNEVKEILTDINNNDIFRYFVLDGVKHSKNLKNNLKGYEQPEIIDAMLTVANNTKESAYIRRNMLLSLKAENSFSREENLNSEIFSIFKDTSAPPEVRGAAITAMHRTGDPNFEYAIQEVFNNYKEFPAKTVQSAIFEAAKTKKNQDVYIPILRKIASETDSEELYGSTILSLGICGGPDAVKAIMENCGRFERNLGCKSALKRNYKTILSMLDLTQSKDIILTGISAAKIAGLTPTIESLEMISLNCGDQELINKSLEAIEYIKNNPASNNYEKMEG
jgi:hypothetical protein